MVCLTIKVKTIISTSVIICIYPSLTDPGTLGHLLGLVREAWKDPLICTANGYPTLRWWVEGARFPEHCTTRKVPGTLYNTEAEALVAALEAAP